MSKRVTWPRSYQAQALMEGWDVFHTDRLKSEKLTTDDGKPYGYRPYELQALVEHHYNGNKKFGHHRWKRDQSAWQWVVRRARAGSRVHRQALGFLKDRSPDEYTAIMAYMKGRK
jgi:hypothetical protein